jgi:hypothetical protein
MKGLGIPVAAPAPADVVNSRLIVSIEISKIAFMMNSVRQVIVDRRHKVMARPARRDVPTRRVVTHAWPVGWQAQLSDTPSHKCISS